MQPRSPPLSLGECFEFMISLTTMMCLHLNLLPYQPLRQHEPDLCSALALGGLLLIGQRVRRQVANPYGFSQQIMTLMLLLATVHFVFTMLWDFVDGGYLKTPYSLRMLLALALIFGNFWPLFRHRRRRCLVHNFQPVQLVAPYVWPIRSVHGVGVRLGSLGWYHDHDPEEPLMRRRLCDYDDDARFKSTF